MPNSTKRRILLVHTGMSHGGVDAYLANLAQLLLDKADLYIFCCNRQTLSKLQAVGMKPLGPSTFRGIGRPLQIILCMLAFPFMRSYLRIDTVWTQGGLGNVFLPLARLLDCSALATRHSAIKIETLGPLRALKHRIVEFAALKLIRYAHKVICVSETVACDLKRSVPEATLHVIPNWVPMPRHPLRPHKGFDEPLNLLFVGRLERFKGVSLIIDALRKLNSPRIASLTIVGCGHQRAELEHQAAGTSTVFVGFQSDPANFYESADIFVNPSDNDCEGMPLVSLEAMSYGLPCIFSDISQNREIVGSTGSALLFRRGDADDLLAKLQICLSDPHLLRCLGERARATALTRFSPEIALSRTMFLLST